MDILNQAQIDFIEKQHKEHIDSVLQNRTSLKLQQLRLDFFVLFQKYLDRAEADEKTEFEKLLGILNDYIFEETYIAYCKGFEDGLKQTK